MNVGNLGKAKILVVGDVMLDQYWLGETSRVSPEAPVPVVRVEGMEARLGGAANVAMNICGLGASATLVGVVGNDENANRFLGLLDKTAIKSGMIRKDNFKTLTKLRVVSRNQQLLRLDFEDEDDAYDSAEVVAACAEHLPGHDAMVISDYGKGAVNRVAARLIEQARSMNKTVVVDPKGEDFGKYKNANVITPNYFEFEQVVGACADEAELHDKATALCADLNLDALLVTRGEKGMSFFARGQPPGYFPAQAKEVYDVTGAGDTVAGLFTAAVAADYSLVDAVKIANLAAGVAVSKFGTAHVTIGELDRNLHRLAGKGKRVADVEELQRSLSAAKKDGEKVVFTNGCFDLIHHGHVACLRDAKSKGDYLVVAVNDDLSVKKLKGADRPVCGLRDRIAVLEELSCVDWIIPFSEDTPLDLIKALRPDVFVKGGDYQKEQLAEFELVSGYGGEVLISPYIEGCSTTRIIHSILDRDENK